MQSEAILTLAPPTAGERLPYGAGPEQFLDLRSASGKGPHPAALVIHGGYWRAKYDLTYAGHICAALAQAGVTTCNLEYRRVGNEGGGWPGTFEDIRSAYRLVRHSAKKFNVDLARLVVIGHSAGAQLALCLAAAESAITRAVSLAGVLDLQRGWELHLSNDAVAAFLGGPPQQVPEHYREASPLDRPMPHVRQKVFHGAADDSVPYAISQDYVARKKSAGEPVELITFDQAGHFELVDPASKQWPRVQQAVVELISAR